MMMCGGGGGCDGCCCCVEPSEPVVSRKDCDDKGNAYQSRQDPKAKRGDRILSFVYP